MYSGCVVSADDGLGPRIAGCSECACRLKRHANSTSPLVFKSVSASSRGSRVAGDVCLSRSSRRLCDGVEDCVGGEDESEARCGRARGLLRMAKEIAGELRTTSWFKLSQTERNGVGA